MYERRLALVAATAALAALAAPLSTAEAKKRPSCKPRHSRTVEVNKAMRVYRIARKTKGGEKVTRTYACRLKTRRRFRLSSLTTDADGLDTGTSAVKLQLRGRYLAYALQDVDFLRSKTGVAPAPGDKVVRLDITRKSAKKMLGQTPTDSTVTDLALTGRGTVAWIFRSDVPPPPASFTVTLADKAGTRALASGPDVVPGSLAISSTFVYWRRAATAFSAKLTP